MDNLHEKFSVIGLSYIEPITELHKNLRSAIYSGGSKTQSSSMENGYAVSTSILTILFVESMLNRILHFEREKGRYQLQSKARINILKFFEKKFNNKELLEKLKELYVFRDLIVHNHILCIRNKWDKDFQEIDINKILTEGYGDSKYNNYVDKSTFKTKNLSLNANPIQICTEDVVKVFAVVKELLEFLEKNCDYPVNFSIINSKFNGTISEYIDQEFLSWKGNTKIR